MSVQQALHFIAAVRHHAPVQRMIRESDPNTSLPELVRIGAEAGFTFAAEDLQTAFRHDWMMRQIRMGPAPLIWTNT